MKYLFISILAAFILTGCSKQLNINEPENQVNREWLKVNIEPSLKVENTFTVSKVITGAVGGQLLLSEIYFISNGDRVTVDIDLTIPAGAFKGVKTISYSINTDNGTIDFLPKMSFDTDLNLDYKLTGIDLSEYTDPNIIDFVYLKNNSFILTSYVSKKVDLRRGILQVEDAKISHFSRYGWATIVEPEPDPGTGE